MSSSLHMLPDGRHIAVGRRPSLAALTFAHADAAMDQFDHVVVLEASTLGDHHARVEQDLRDARRLNGALRDELDVLKGQLAELAPYAAAGKAAALEAAKREYHSGTCDDCSCCTTAQCAEDRCPTNSVGESTCPCTCY